MKNLLLGSTLGLLVTFGSLVHATEFNLVEGISFAAPEVHESQDASMSGALWRCYAEDGNGQLYYAEDYDRSSARRHAMRGCKWNSRYCRPVGCRRE